MVYLKVFSEKFFDNLKSDISDFGKEMVVQFGAGGMSLKNLTRIFQ